MRYFVGKETDYDRRFVLRRHEEDDQSIANNAFLRRHSRMCMDHFRVLSFFVGLFQSLALLLGRIDGVHERIHDKGRCVVLYQAINRDL